MKPARTRRIHRWVGLALVLPCGVWAVTGLLFHWKPGWAEAYGSLAIKTYPLESRIVEPTGDWHETRRLRSALGEHLLVRTGDGWRQWDPDRDAPRTGPSAAEIRALLDDALAEHPDRYGAIETLDGRTATTSTGVEVSLDWETMRLSQRGRDTRRIDRIYKLHYLQWTGTALGDRVLPIVGLAGLAALTALGLRLWFRG